MSRSGRQPKETDEIKGLLGAFMALKDRIDKTEKRKEMLEDLRFSPSTSKIGGIGGSGSGDRSSKQERDQMKIDELEEKLGDMYAEENRKREELEDLVIMMKKPKEQTIIEMRYFDDFHWREISVALFGEEPDYDENEERYLKRVYKIHGSALQSLAKIYKQQKGF